jgi:hypothetical protein
MGTYNFLVERIEGSGTFNFKQNKYNCGFIFEIYSNGNKILHLDGSFDSCCRNIKNILFKGKTEAGVVFSCDAHLNGVNIDTKKGCYQLSFLVITAELNNGNFKKGTKNISYILYNLDLGEIRCNYNIFINNRNMHLYPYSFKNSYKLLKMYGGRQVTAVCSCESKTTYASPELLQNLLYLISFLKGNFVGIDEIQIYQNTHYRRIFLNYKTYSYGNEGIIHNLDDFGDIINSTHKNYESVIKRINRFNDLIEIYLECLRNTIIESQMAMVAVLFEGLKARYINSNLIVEKKWIITKKNGPQEVEKSFEELLIEIFNLEKFKYNKKQLKSLICLRNNIIHEASYTTRKKSFNFKDALRIYLLSLNLFERFVCHLIKYTGNYWKKSAKGYKYVTLKKRTPKISNKNP